MNLLVFFSIFFALSFSNLTIANSYNDENQGSNTDRNALLAFKSEISHDPHGVLNNWNASLSICQWQGVTCGDKVHQRVVSLTFSSKGLVGTLSPFVGNLSFLHTLYLSDNSFQGAIPTQISQLRRLRYLVLEINYFTGEIPANISRCLKLKSLALGKNHLGGTVPPKLAFLPNLKILALQENKFVGNLLDIVVNMTSLETLSAAANSFEGSIPHSIGRLKNLTYFALSQNKISGTFPPSFYNLSSLRLIDLDLNQLEGTLPPDIGFRFPQLKTFKISGNFFHGHVPTSLSNLTQLIYLAIYSNNFTGKFLFNARNMPDLLGIDIASNYLGTGDEGDLNFLQTLSNCSRLHMLGLSSNNLGGILTPFIGNLSTQITELYLDQNQITGTIPPAIFNLINLRRLGFEENNLSGYLPQEIGNLIKLEAFSCRSNNLIGSIPNSLGNLSMLYMFYLDFNNFVGEIPSTLGNCTNLLYLGLSTNNLTGSLLSQLFQASVLVELYLQNNHLQGTVPEEIGQMKNLVVLDLSRNAFTGEAPKSLGTCVGLVLLHLGENFFTETIPQTFKSLTSVQYLNLSHNSFSGQIPNFLSNFSLMALDLSFNNFEGEVPTTGIFRNLSALSLSGNSKLCGGISELHLPRCPANATRRPNRRSLSPAVIVIIAIASLIASVSIFSSVYLIYSKRIRYNLSNESSPTAALPKVSYIALYKATNGFSEANLLGTGHFGSVYKGVLDQESMVAAVKVMSLKQQGASKSFAAECKALRNIRHRNLVKIVTACLSTDFERNDFKALVYEFMSNGNLERWIHVDQMDGNEDHQQTLSLQQRLNIAIDLASALDYLHNGCEIPVIHCDLKPSNILLDDEMVAHVGDFGLARFHSNPSTRNSSSLFIKGTVGYAAPEYGLGSMVSKEGDIYSYGIVLIEMMTAVKPTDEMFEGGLNLHQHAKLALSDQLATIIDPTLLADESGSSYGYQDQNLARNGRKIGCIKSVIELGVRCSMESPQERMSMKDVIKELQAVRDNISGARR